MRPSIAINLDNEDYAGWANLANRTVSGISGNASFTTPNPALITVSAASAAVTTGIAVWGPVGNRGSHGSLVDLRSKTLTLAHLVRSLAAYVMSTAAVLAGDDDTLMAAIITSSGFTLKRTGAPVGALPMVQNFRQIVSTTLHPSQGEVAWTLPLGVTANNVDFFKVLRSTGTSLAAAVVIGYPSDTKFIDTNTTGAVVIYNYWCIPVAHGHDGVPSAMVTITLAA
jgi:hypothetical protein